MKFTFDTKNLSTDGPIIDALRNGKTIQYWDGVAWYDYTESGSIDLSVVRERRIKPSAPQFRPWTAEEVPVGAQIRNKLATQKERTLILAVDVEGLRGLDWNESLAECFHNNEHSLDGGKTWLPCGIQE
jgi:hypothetical protein